MLPSCSSRNSHKCFLMLCMLSGWPSQVTVRIGSPVSGYGQESRNRAARQRIPNRVWTDEDGIEHVEVTPHWYLMKYFVTRFILFLFVP